MATLRYKRSEANNQGELQETPTGNLTPKSAHVCSHLGSG